MIISDILGIHIRQEQHYHFLGDVNCQLSKIKTVQCLTHVIAYIMTAYLPEQVMIKHFQLDTLYMCIFLCDFMGV